MDKRTHHYSGRTVRPALLTHRAVEGTRAEQEVDNPKLGRFVTWRTMETVCGLTLPTAAVTRRPGRTDCAECRAEEPGP